MYRYAGLYKDYTGDSSLFDAHDRIIYLTKSLEEDKKKLEDNTKEVLTKFLFNKTGKTPDVLVKEWFDKIQSCCFQGGYGYSFQYENSPHHWVIRPERYEEVIPDDLIQMAAEIVGFKFKISDKAATENWGN